MPFLQKVVVENSMIMFRRVLSACCIALGVGWAAAAVAGLTEDLINAAERGDAATVQALLAKGPMLTPKRATARPR